jgi:hypothetical protein
MKIIAFIFLLLVGFLIIQPALSSTQKTYASKIMCMKGMCCAKKHCSKKAEKEKSENDCNKCNPFMACAYGNFFVNELPFDYTAIVSMISTKLILTNDKVISSYIADCWHPPKKFLS